MIRKRRYDPPGLCDVDRNFGEEYVKANHGKVLCDELKIDHLTKFQQEILTAVVEEYWRVFSKQGVTPPAKDYGREIDTGDAKPIRCKNPTFGPHETPIIKKPIAKLVELGMADQIYDDGWSSKPLLAAKPHQENVTDIDDFV